MHNEIERFLSSQFTNTTKEIDDFFTIKEAEWNSKMESYKKTFNDKIQEFKRVEDQIKPDISDLKSELSLIKDFKIKHNNIYIDSIVYDNIITALEQGIITKVGNPAGWNESSHRDNNPWNGKTMLCIGSGENAVGNGLQTTIPQGYDVLWLRSSNHVWGVYRVSYADGGKEEIGAYTNGYRNLNEFSPDGGSADAYNTVHKWQSIAVPRAGLIQIRSGVNSQAFLSGIAFGKNLWNHASNSAIAYHWAVNGGVATGWSTENWNNDNLAFLPAGKVSILSVPVVKNNKDKILYIIEHNNDWLGTMHTSVNVNGSLVKRLRTSYHNPFATHFNSKLFQRYMAALIPKEIVNGSPSNFLNVRIDMTNQNNHIHFREIGTHDLE